MRVDRKARVRKFTYKDHQDGKRGLRESFAMVPRKSVFLLAKVLT